MCNPYIRPLLLKSLAVSLSSTFNASLLTGNIMMSLMGNNKTETENYLAASTLIGRTAHLAVVFSISGFFAVSILCREYYKELNKQNISAIEKTKYENLLLSLLKSCFYIGAPLFFFTGSLLFFSKTVLVFIFKQDAEIAELAQKFLRPYTFALPTLISRVCLANIILAFDMEKIGAVMALISFGMGIGTAYLFAFKLSLGLAGLAYGFILDAFLLALGYAYLIKKHSKFKNYNFWKCSNLFKLDSAQRQQIKELIGIGGPLALTYFFELASSLFFTSMAGWLGIETTAAQNFVNLFLFFAIIPTFAIATVSSMTMADLCKNQPLRESKLFAITSLLTSCFTMLPLCLSVLIYPKLLTLLSSDSVSEAVVEKTILMGKISAMGVLCDNLRLNMIGVLRGAGDKVVPSVIANLALIATATVSAVLITWTDLGILVLPTGYSLSFALGSLLLLPRWISKTQGIESISVLKKTMVLFRNCGKKSNCCRENPEPEGLQLQQQLIPAVPSV